MLPVVQIGPIPMLLPVVQIAQMTTLLTTVQTVPVPACSPQYWWDQWLTSSLSCRPFLCFLCSLQCIQYTCLPCPHPYPVQTAPLPTLLPTVEIEPIPTLLTRVQTRPVYMYYCTVIDINSQWDICETSLTSCWVNYILLSVNTLGKIICPPPLPSYELVELVSEEIIVIP